MTAPQQPGTPPDSGKGKAKGGGLIAAVKRNPALAVAGAAGLAAAVVLARRKTPAASSQDSAGAGATGYADTGTATPYSYGGYGGDSGYDNQMAGLQSQLQALTTQVSDLNARERNDGRPKRKPGRGPGRRRRRPGAGPHPPGGKTGIRGGH